MNDDILYKNISFDEKQVNAVMKGQETGLSTLHLVCPCRERSSLVETESGAWCCSSAKCPYGKTVGNGFPIHCGVPVLIAFDIVDTVCDPQVYTNTDGASVREGIADDAGYIERRSGQVFSFFRRVVHGNNKIARQNSGCFLEVITEGKPGAVRVLNIGSGTKGAGADLLYEDSRVELVGVDIYASPSVDFICDAHFLPFADESFDGVWIQAVLEHVQNPDIVVHEITRVLRPNGIVYAETPFMQQVHEGAYDFTRFTGVGHRNLFREFEEVAKGIVSGPGVTLGWAIRYYFIALTRSRKIGSILALPFQMVCRLLDHLIVEQEKWDGANGLWFMGRKNLDFQGLTARQVISTYRGRF